MREWVKPELEDLSIGRTENTYVLGKNPDGEKIELCWGWEIPLKSDPYCNLQPGIKK